MKISNRDENKILKELSKSSSKKTVKRPLSSDYDKSLYNVGLKKFIKSIGFYCLTEDLVFFRKNDSVFYILNLFPEVNLEIPSEITFDNFQVTKVLAPQTLKLSKKVVDIKMTYFQEVFDGPISKKIEISFQLVGYDYEVVKKYEDYAQLNMMISLGETPKMIESTIYEQLFDNFNIQHNLKTDLLSKNLGVTLPELFKEWQNSQIEISDHVYIDPSYSNADVVGNLVKVVNGSK